MLFRWSGKSADGAAGAVRLAEAMDLSEFSFFKKDSVKQVLTFVSRNVVDRSAAGERSSVAHDEYVAHVRVTADVGAKTNLACVVITDKEYPSRVAFDVIRQSLDAFKAAAFTQNWRDLDQDTLIVVPLLDSLLQQYKRPEEVDKIMKIQKDVDETKAIMLKNLEDMLERGEKIDDLVRKSNDLSIHSKTFVKDTKKLNSCCR